MVGVGMLAGIGFTMSLFIGMLGFEGQSPELAAATRLGVIGGSVASAVAGYLALRFTLPRTTHSATDASVTE
jgi:NhaA family Na+:H+ antiporter